MSLRSFDLTTFNVKVIRSNGSFAATVHHQSTSTGLFTNFDSFIPMLYLFLVISTFARLMYFPILKWKNSRKRSLLTVILQQLWIVVSNHFLIKSIILEIKFILAKKRLYIFVFLSLVIMVCKFGHNFRNLFLLPIHIFPYVSSSVLLSIFPTEIACCVFVYCKCQCWGALYVGQTPATRGQPPPPNNLLIISLFSKSCRPLSFNP